MATAEDTGEREITSQNLLSKLARYVLDASDCVDLDRYEPYVDILRRAFAPSLEHRLIEALEHLSRVDPDDENTDGDGSMKSSLLCELQEWIESTGAMSGFGQDASSLGALVTDTLLVSGRLERLGKQLGRLDLQCSQGDTVLQSGTPISSTPAELDASAVNVDNPEQSTGGAGTGETAVSQEALPSENPTASPTGEAEGEDQLRHGSANSAATNHSEPELKPAKVRLVVTEVCENKSRQRTDCLKIPCDPKALERKIFKNSEEPMTDSNKLEKIRKRLDDLCTCLNNLTRQMSRESVGDLVLHCRIRESSLCLKVIRQSSNICMLASRVTLIDCAPKRKKFFRLFASKSDPSPCPCNADICKQLHDETLDKLPWNEVSESFGISGSCATTPSGEISASHDEFVSSSFEANLNTGDTADDSAEFLTPKESSFRTLPSRSKNRPIPRCPCEVEEINDKFDVVCLSRGCRGGKLSPTPKVVCGCCEEKLDLNTSSPPTTCTSSNENNNGITSLGSRSDEVECRPSKREEAKKEKRESKKKGSVDVFASLSAYKERRKCFKFDPYSLSISRETEDEVAICDRMYCEDYPCDNEDDQMVPPCRNTNRRSVAAGGSDDRVEKKRQQRQKQSKTNVKVEYCKGSGRGSRDQNGRAAIVDKMDKKDRVNVSTEGEKVLGGVVRDREKDVRDACTSTECMQVASIEVKQQQQQEEDEKNEGEECPELTNIYINEISLCYCSRPDWKREVATNTDDPMEEQEDTAGEIEQVEEEEKTLVDASTNPEDKSEKKDCSTQACMKAVLFCACSNKTSVDDKVSNDNGDQSGSNDAVIPAEQSDKQTMTDPALLLLLELRSSRERSDELELTTREQLIECTEEEPVDHVGTIKSKIREIVELNERMREQVVRMSSSARVSVVDAPVVSCSTAVQTTNECGEMEKVEKVDVELQIDEEDRLKECHAESTGVATQTPRKRCNDDFEALQRQYSSIMRKSREMCLLSCCESKDDGDGVPRLRLTLSTSSCLGAASGGAPAAAGDQTRDGSLRNTCRCSRRANLLEYLSERLSRDGLERLKRLLRLLLKKLKEKGHEIRRGWRSRPTSCCRRCCCCSRCSLPKRSACEARTAPAPCVRCDCRKPRGARLAGGAGGDGDHPGTNSQPTLKTRSGGSGRYRSRRTRQQHQQVTGVRSSLDLGELEARRLRIRAFASKWAERPRSSHRVDVYEPSIASLPLSRSWRYS